MNSKFGSGFTNFCKAEAPTLMTIGALGGLIISVILAGKLAPKAKKVMEEAKEEEKKLDESTKKAPENTDSEREETKSTPVDEKEVKSQKRILKLKSIMKAAKVMAPVIIAVAITAGLMIGANRIAVRRIAIAAGAYEMVNGDLKKYKDKLAEVVGEKKAEEIHNAVAQEKVNERLGKDGYVNILETGHGDTLYYDEWSGRPFRASDAWLEHVCSIISKEISVCQFSSFNDLYMELGIDGIGAGENMGFTDWIEPLYRNGYVTLPDGKKAISLYFNVKVVSRPKYGDDVRETYRR